MTPQAQRAAERLAAERDRIERILVLKWSAMGDIVMASAAFQDIVDAFPGRSVDLNVLPPWDSMFAGDPRFRRVLAVDTRARRARWRNQRAWLRAVRAGRYDIVFDLQSSDHTRTLLAALVLSGGAPRFRVGFHPRFPWNVTAPALPDAVHASRYATEALRAAGVASRTPRPVLHVPPESRARAAALLRARGIEGVPYAVFLPGCQAAGYLKRWGAERYAALAVLLRASGIERVLLLGGEDEADECAAIAGAAPGRVVDLCGETSLAELVPICQAARLIVANDTGTAHVASATGTPLLVICGPTDPRRVRPIGPAVKTLQANLPCINCYRKHCPHHSCMKVITPECALTYASALLHAGPRP